MNVATGPARPSARRNILHDWFLRAAPLTALAALISAAVLVWDHAVLHGYGLAEVAARPLYYLAHSALDLAVLFPVTLVALGLGGLLAKGLGMRKQGWNGVLARSACAGVLLLVLLVPGSMLRLWAHPELDGLLVAVAGAEAVESSPFCTFGALINEEIDAAGGGSAVTLLLAQGTRGALMDLVGMIPLFVLGLSLLAPWRRDAWGPIVAGMARATRQAVTVAVIAVAALAIAATALSRPAPALDTGADWAAAKKVLKVDEKNTGEKDKGNGNGNGGSVCTAAAATRSYDVSAIAIDMTLNRFGDHDPGAYMYVLDSRIDEVRQQETWPLPDRVSNGLRTDPIQPLVLRANLGECVTINFTNQLEDGPASIHIHGLSHTIENAGSTVGYNPNTFAQPGQTISYVIQMPTDPYAERAYYFHDHGASRQRVSHGLFGALVGEPAGSVFYDVETGDELTRNNWEAIIAPPGEPAFREFVIMYHEIGDENFDGIMDEEGKTIAIIDEISQTYRPSSRGLNYRSEPFSNRLRLKEDKSQGYGSYMFGDPSTPIPRSYLGEPTKTRLMHGGSEIFHVHHLHGGGDRWRRNPNADPNNDISSGLTKKPVQDVFSTHLDSQSIGPGTSYNLEHECGAGGCQQAAGDFLYHCHIGHHYLAGMWAFWRVFDTEQPDLAHLPDMAPTPAGVDSTLLVGMEVEGKTLVPAAQLVDPATERSLEAWIEAQLPPKGARFDDGDATVWDWDLTYVDGNPLYLGEPEDTTAWANYASDAPGVRPEIQFNPGNARYAWPLMRPHLGKRPPFAANGHSGAPWLGEEGTAARPDGLCPNQDVVANPLQNRRQYPITAITLPLQISPDEVDEQAMIFTLGDEKEDILNGIRPANPLAIRSNVGDCVDVLLTSELDGPSEEHHNELTDAGDSYSKINMHIHFVQFDPQASDGVITGMSYEQSVRPYSSEERAVEVTANAGDTVLTVSHTERLRVGIYVGIGLGEGMCNGGTQMCTEVRKITGITDTTITVDQPLDFDHAIGEAVGVEFVRYAWYSDVDTGTVFWHDHVNFRRWDRGTFGAHIIEPTGSTYHDPVTGEEVRSGTIVDIHTPPDASIGAGQQGSFREYMVFHHNRQNAAFGDVLGDVGASFNLRSEPMDTRGGEPAYWMSSVTHGDPMTPLPRAYVGDPVVFRHLGVVEKVGAIRVTGHRFRLERWAPTGDLSDTSPLGISERFDLVLDGGAGGPGGKPGDYLYYSTIAREFMDGAWGILRVHDREESDLQPLPDRPLPTGDVGFPVQSHTGLAPAPATGPGDVCPDGAPLRSYDIEFGPAYIVTSDDPVRVHSGWAFMPQGTSDSQYGNTGGPIIREPLTLRVNDGECLEVNLTNRDSVHRASFQLGELAADPVGSAGSAVGFNDDSTVEPGGSRTYRFYADRELGTQYFLNMAAPDTIPHGGFGGLVVEPAGSEFIDPYTGGDASMSRVADVVSPSGNFREFVTLFHDHDKVIGQNRMPYPRDVEGFTGIGYAADYLGDREMEYDPTGVFDSEKHGDPRLVFQAHQGDPVVFRVAAPWAEQMHVFAMEGHRWPQEPGMVGSEQMFSRILAPGYSFEAPLIGGAGGDNLSVGEFLFQDHRHPFTEAGLWGIFNVLEEGSRDLRPLNGGGGRFGVKHRRGEDPAPLGQIISAIKKMEEPPGPITMHSEFASIELEFPGAERGAIKLPMRKGLVGDRLVWFVLSDTSDEEFAEEEGTIFAHSLAEAPDSVIEEASFDNGRWVFNELPGTTTHFDPDTGELVTPVANTEYSPLKRITWRDREIIVNVPFIVWGDGPGEALLVDRGGCDPLIRRNSPSPFFVGDGPGGCTPDQPAMDRYEGGQVFSIDIKRNCDKRIDTRQCATVTMKAQIAIHRKDLFSYYTVFDATKAPPAGFMGVIHAPKMATLSDDTFEEFSVSSGENKAVGHIMQFHNGVSVPAGGPKRFQPGLTSYSSPFDNAYSPMWHITWLHWDCNGNGTHFVEDRNVSFGAAPAAGSGIPGFDPADPATFDPFQTEEKGVDCTELAIAATGDERGFIYFDELQRLKELGYVIETQAPSGWNGTILGEPNTHPLIVNCPTHVSVDLRDLD